MGTTSSVWITSSCKQHVLECRAATDLSLVSGFLAGEGPRGGVLLLEIPEVDVSFWIFDFDECFRDKSEKESRKQYEQNFV